MDSTKKDQLQTNNLILLLPDDAEKSDGPATLFMVPRDAINAWINITPELNEALEKLRAIIISKAVKKDPEKMKHFLLNEEVPLDDTLINDIMKDGDYLKVMTTISIAALVDLRNTMGHDEFNSSYTVTDREIIEEFTTNASWKLYDPTEGWASPVAIHDVIDYSPDSGTVTIKSVD